MASFTEQATLKVVDQSSAQLRKINAALKQLFATAKSLKSTSAQLKVTATGLNQTLAGLRKLHAEAKKETLAKSIRPAVVATQQLGAATATTTRQSVAGIRKVAKAQQDHNAHIIAADKYQEQLRRRTQSGVPRVTQYQTPRPWGQIPPPAGRGGGRGGGGAPPHPTAPGPRYGGGGRGRTPGGALLGGFGGGIGIGLGRLNESFGAVALAGYGAAKALSAVAKAGFERDRAQLAVDTQTSQAQRDVFNQLDKEAKARGDLPPALRYKTDQFNLARASFLGDVGNAQVRDPKTGLMRDRTFEELKSPEAQRERAERADFLARDLYKNVVPGMYARNPNLSQVEAQEELKKYVQTLGITTQKMFERNAQGQLQFSEDYKRVAEGIRLAQIGAPDLTMGQMRTAAAAIKSLGYTATATQIAEILYNVSSKGQRAANESYQMYRAGMGVNDVKKLNNTIEDLGLFLPGTAQRNKKNNVIAGTGVPVEFPDQEDPSKTVKLGERPSEWWRLAMQSQEVKKRAREMLIKQASQAPLQPGQTRQQAISEAKDKYEKDDATAVTDYINRALAGARGTALQGVLDAILGGDIAKAGLAQAATAPKPDEIEKRMGESWSVAATNLGTELSNAAATTGEFIANLTGANTALQTMANFVGNNQLLIGGIGVTIATGVGVAVVAAMVTPAAMLTGAAEALTAAAGRLGVAAGVPDIPGAPGGDKPGPKTGGTLGRAGSGIGLSGLLGRAGIVAAVGYVLYEAFDAFVKPTLSKGYDPETGKYTSPGTAAKAAVAATEATLPTAESAIKEAVTKAVTDHLNKPTTPPVTTPPKTATAAATTTAATPAEGNLATLIPQLAATANSINLAVTGLTTAGTSFSAVFSTAATSLGNAGQIAASALTNAAPGIGATIGSTAAAAISAATANINVNVNNSAKAPDKGSLTP